MILSTNSRLLAYRILSSVEAGAQLQEALNKAKITDKQERPFITFLTKGVVRNKIKLETLISSFSSIPLAKIDPEARLFLMIGLFQIQEMDSVPDYAAINETVSAMKREQLHKASGFVNGILRAVARKREKLQTVNENNSGLDLFSVKYSWPPWLLERYEKQYGSDLLEKVLISTHMEPATTLFVNLKKVAIDEVIRSLEREGINAKKDKYFNDMLTIEGGMVSETLAFRDGMLYIQDTASRLVARVVSLVSRGRILDAASAPGGKSINLLADGHDVTSADINQAKLEMLKENFSRMGFRTDDVMALDASADLPFDDDDKFDTILLDAPCSATGRIRRAPEIKYHLKPESFESLHKTQTVLIANLSGYVRGGGHLIYSTCSIDREENEKVIEKFLSDNQEYSLVDPMGFLPNELEIFILDNKYIKTLPHIGEMDGFFIAVMKKAE